MEEEVEVLILAFQKIVENMKPLDPEFSKTVDDNFWELIDNE